MGIEITLPPELETIGQAMGLFDSNGDLEGAWFDDPVGKLEDVLTAKVQRDALIGLLDLVLPSNDPSLSGIGADEKWHPLLQTQPNGNFYLTVDHNQTADTVTFGVGARYATAGSTAPTASISVRLPLIRTDSASQPTSTVSFIAGKADGPLSLTLAVALGWQMPTAAITLGGISLSLRLAPFPPDAATADIAVTLIGLDTDGSGAQDVTLDPGNLGPEALHIIVGLVCRQLRQSAPAGSVAAHILALLGLEGTPPVFPFTTIVSDPGALTSWARALVTPAGSSPAPMQAWLCNLASLFGVTAIVTATPSAGGTEWSVPFFALSATSAVTLNVSQAMATDGVTPQLTIGVGFSLVPSATAAVRFDASVALIKVSLAGQSAPTAFPSASLIVTAPGDPSQQPWLTTANISVDSLRAGVLWNGSALMPLLEIDNVAFQGQTYPVVNLTNANSVVAAASGQLVGNIVAALGNSPIGLNLALLAGLVRPASAPTAPLVDFAQLAAHPLSAIATLHRNALLSTAYPWSNHFAELAALLSISGAVGGTGTFADPWVAAIASFGPLTVQLAAWNAQTSGNAADPQLLRVGVRAFTADPSISASWTTELLAVDMPSSGANTIALLGAHHAALTFIPGGVQEICGVTLTADSISATLDIVAGSDPAVSATVVNLVFAADGGTLTLPRLAFPFPSGFDVQNPLPSLGVSAADLEILVRGLLSRALCDAFGGEGLAVAALLGAAPGAPGLQSDFPVLGDPNAPGSLFADPVAALQAWISSLAIGLSADGTDFASSLAAWLAGFLAKSLPDDLYSGPDPSALDGSGTYDDPWLVPLGDAASQASGLLWLEPNGPPSSAAAAAALVGATDDLPALADAIASLRRCFPALPAGLSPDTLAAGLQSLSDHLAATDGVVPLASQIPGTASWSSGTAITAPHHLQPGDASACAQILTQIDAWTGQGGQRAVLLLGPAFSDHSIWTSLLAQAETAHPGTTSASANFDLRLSNVDPASIDLRGVTVVADYYTADLQSDGSGNTVSLVAQIGLIVAQISSLRPGVKLTIVAHSTAGVVARLYAAANAGGVQGLITLGTPHTGAPLTPLTDPATAEALRWIRHVFLGGFAASPVQSAVQHLLSALDGYLPASPNALPQPWTYPIGDFAGSATTDTGGVPALALGGLVGGAADLLAELKTAATAAINGVTTLAPTHLAWGVRGDVTFGADVGVAVDAAIRLDVGRLALRTAAPEPAHAAQALYIDAALWRPGGWLVGGALGFAGLSQPAIDVRVRSADLGLAMTLSNGVLTATPRADLHEASFHDLTGDLVGWGDAQLEALLGSVFQTITATAPAANTSLGGLLWALEKFGIAAPDPHGGIGIATGALDALAADPLGYLAPKVVAVLADADTTLGFTSSAPNRYGRAIANLPIEIFVQTSPPAIGLRTIPATAGLALADGIDLAFSVSLALATMSPDISASLAVGPATLDYANATLILAVPPALPSLQIYPTTATAAAAFANAVEALAVSGALSALAGSVLDDGYSSFGLYAFLNDPGAWLVRSNSLGNGTVLDPAKINALLQIIGQAIGTPVGQGLTFPGGVTLAASGQSPTTLSLSTAPSSAIGSLSFSFGLIVDATRHLTPDATVTLQAALPGGSWQSVAITLGSDPSGISLVVTPGSGQPIQLLPTFGGAAALMGAATMLLPAVLDELVAAVTPSSGLQPALLAVALDIGTALKIYGPQDTFAQHDSAFAWLLAGDWSLADIPGLVAGVAGLFNGSPPPLQWPSWVSVQDGTTPDTLTWTFPLANTVSGQVVLTAGFDSNNADAPIVKLEARNIQIAGAPFAASITCGYESGPTLDVTVDIKLDSLGLTVAPEFVLGLSGGQTTLTFLPLGAGSGGTFAIGILPTLQVSPPMTVAAAEAAVEALLKSWGIPLAADILIGAAQPNWNTPLWAGGKSIGYILQAAGIVTGNTLNPAILTAPFSTTVVNVLSGLLQAVASTASIQLTDDLQLGLVSEGGKLGVRLLGSFALSRASAPQISLLFGKPASWLGPDAGVTLFLFSGPPFQFKPELNVRGLGLGVAGDGDTPLVNDPKFRIGAIDGYVAFDVDFSNGGGNLNFGGGLEIDQLGLPFGQLQGANSSNPVASSLLGSDAGSGNGDAQAVNPGVDVSAYYLDGTFTLVFGGTDQPIVIPVHRNLGPVYIDQIDIALDKSGSAWAVVVGIDGSVTLSSLAIGIDELAVRVPLDSIMTPSGWSLDLQGLAVGFTSGPVEIAGGLRKVQRTTIEYDGMLSVTAADIGLTIVGAYSRPSDADGSYTSLFVFGAATIPLGGPPFMFITGLGAGGGYNRELIAPTDMNDIGSFILVSAIDDGSLANDPMGALMQVSTSFPARRGAFWLAAGIRFTTFELVNSTAVVTVALDGGFEIDVLGISRMALPTEETALVSVELALKARYNSEENLLSVQAQLTDNSYLFDRHCQLTGGFAFFMWFSQGQFVLTLGGYNPSFSKPPQFPDVPRLGYNWSLSGDIVIKGGSYFALTNSCVMAGGSLSVTASFGPVDAWFNAYVDFLVAWDPFAYSFDVGIEIGARFQIKICLFHHCVTIGKSVSIGASLAISGPPFHGTATVDLEVATITVSFGGTSSTPVYITDWDVFTQKYLSVGTSGEAVVSIQFKSGLLPSDPPGAQLQPGSAAGPLKVGAEFSFTTTTRMPASTTTDFVNAGQANSVAGVNALDIAPMDKTNVGSTHTLQLDMFVQGAWVAVSVSPDQFTITPKTGFFPEAMWHWVDPHQLPAAARTITAVAGFDVDAHALLVDPSAVIPISTLVDDLSAFALALPFGAMAQTVPLYQNAGVWADMVAALGATASGAAVLTASAGVLSGQDSVFARNRQAFGLPAQGLAPLAAAALAGRRSAPPLLTPLTTGLTMKPVGLAPPRIAQTVALVDAVLLDQPRLRSVTRTVAQVAADAPVAARTSVRNIAALAGVPRMRPPVPADVVGAQLIKVRAANARQPTKAALSARALRNADFGAAVGVAHLQAFTRAASDLTADGVVLGAGATHIWDIPGDGGAFTISGNAAVRMLCTDRSGAMLRDLEFVAAGSPVQQLPPGTALVAIECLGALGAETASLAAAPGAVTTAYAPTGKAPAVGWQNASMLAQIGPARFVARGATLRLARRNSARRGGQVASYGMVCAADALRGQIAVETSLPASIDVVIVMLDGLGSSASQLGDLALAVQGATLAGAPQRVLRGNRRCLCYDVTARDENATSFTVSASNSSVWSIAGVVGVKGTAIEWATRLRSGALDGLIPDGAIAPGGSLTVKYDSGATKT